MYILLWLLTAIPIGIFHYWSVEYEKLEQKYGPEKASLLVKRYGSLAGDLGMLFLVGLWILPQPRFRIPLFSGSVFHIPFIQFSIPYFHLITSLPFITYGLYLIIQALIQMGREMSIEHRKPEKILADGVFSIVRHPQNFGGAVVHIGMSLLFSAEYALLLSPVLIFFDYLIAAKEEKELIRVFGKAYEEYQIQVPMFFPKRLRPSIQ